MPRFMVSVLSPKRAPWARGSLHPSLLALLLVDASLYLDATLRWENGFGFARPAWLATTVTFLGSVALTNSLLLRFRAPGWVHAFAGFVAMTVGFVLASTGNPFFDWRSYPLLHRFMIQNGLDSYWMFEGGKETALVALVAHGIWGPWGRAVAPVTRLSKLLRSGVALIVVSFVGLIPPVRIYIPRQLPEGYSQYVDPRSSPDEVAALRRAWWLGMLGVGVLSSLAGVDAWRRARRPSTRS